MASEKKRFVIIDGNAVVHRAFHALPPLRTKKGELVNAVYGFLVVFLKAVKEFQPDFVAAAFDVKGPTFRHKKYGAYKAKRPKAPDELYEQIPKVKRVLEGFGVKIFEKEGYEADDIIGTMARTAPRKQIVPPLETIIVSGDLDALQLINQNTKVYVLRKGVKDTVVYDEEKVREKYEGLLPEQLTDLRALRGDASDNIPGVTGIGEKTATALLKDFGSLENLYSEISEKTPKSLKISPSVLKKLSDYKDQAFISKQLAEIKKDVEIDFELKYCGWQNYDKEKARNVLEGYEFYSLAQKLPSSDKEQKIDAPEKIVKNNLRLW